MNSWEQLFKLQHALALESFGRSKVGKRERLNRALLALGAEVGELVNSCAGSWKWWSSRSQNRRETKDELADVLLFVVLIADEIGISPSDLLRVAAIRLRKVADRLIRSRS